MNCLGVIPSRYGSVRLSAKPLRDIAGKPLIQRVWEQVQQTKSISRIVIATDDPRIEACAKSFGADVIMTSPDHPSGTDRIAEVARLLAVAGETYPLVANIQGDMPFINPAVIDRTVAALANLDQTFGMATAAGPISTIEEYHRPASVKVVCDLAGGALYFSRTPIPHWRDAPKMPSTFPIALKHIGLYVYRSEVLAKLTKLPPTDLERRESLEQLRALAHGIRIHVSICSAQELAPGIEVDTEEDLAEAIRYVKQHH